MSDDPSPIEPVAKPEPSVAMFYVKLFAYLVALFCFGLLVFAARRVIAHHGF
jgi:hypothetical protein